MLFVKTDNPLILKSITLLLIFSTFSASVFARSTSDFSKKTVSVQYFKSPTSSFPSGETTLERLEQNQTDSLQAQTSYYSYKNQKISKNILKVTTALDLSASTSLRDIGFFLTLKTTHLKENPDVNSKTIFKINPQTKFTAIGFKNGFVYLQFKNRHGFINISDCMSKFDFAKAIYAKNPKKNLKQWFYVKSRSFDQIETINDGPVIHLSQVEGVFPDANKAIVSTTDQSLALWTSVEIKTETDVVWRKSAVPGHGIVYWKTNPVNTNPETKIKIDELLKKEISFVSFNPKNPKQAIASAHGLFITNDGENWREIDQFKDYTGPVLFYNEFLIFAGNYKSTDAGLTFENYIQIEKLSEAITDSMGYFPKRLQVKKIKTIKPFKVEVDLDIGNRVIKVQTPVYSQEWKVVKI